jgi:hypothetical protein
MVAGSPGGKAGTKGIARRVRDATVVCVGGKGIVVVSKRTRLLVVFVLVHHCDLFRVAVSKKRIITVRTYKQIRMYRYDLSDTFLLCMLYVKVNHCTQ